MARPAVESLFRRHSAILIIISILATTLTLASGFLPAYSLSPQRAGFPIPWETTPSVSCIPQLAGSEPSSHALRINPCPVNFQPIVNWFFLATDVLIYTSIGYALVPIFRKPGAKGIVVAVLAGILAMTLASVPVFHKEIGTGYPTIYDKHGFPLTWITFVTGGVLCQPGFSCPTSPRAEFNWVSLTFDAILYVAIASATLFILRPRFLNTPAQPGRGTLKTQNN